MVYGLGANPFGLRSTQYFAKRQIDSCPVQKLSIIIFTCNIFRTKNRLELLKSIFIGTSKTHCAHFFGHLCYQVIFPDLTEERHAANIAEAERRMKPYWTGKIG